MKNKGFALSVIVVLFALTMIISCSETTNNSLSESSQNISELTNDNIEEVNKRYLITEDLPNDTYDSYEFRVLTRDADHHLKEVQADSENGETINDAVYYRNRAIEERFDVKIKILTTPEVTESELTDFYKKVVLAGEDAFDLALPHMVNAGVAATLGIMYDWHSIPYINFDKPWWNKVAIDELTVNNKLYLAISDYCISSMDYTWVMIYNYQMGENYNISDIFDTVKSGNWTIDKFTEYIKFVSTDVDGNGVFDYNDIYGFTTHNNSAVVNWMFALDQKITQMDSDGYPQLILNTDKMVNIVNKIYNILYNDNNTLIVDAAMQDAYQVDLHDKAVAKKFEQNESMFAAIRILYIDLLRNMESEFGIIPFPKYDTLQSNYYTHVDGHAPLMSVPITISNPERTGVIIEALSAETYREVVPAVMDIVLQSKYARDDQSYEMLELVLDGRVYTFGYIYDGWKGLQWALVKMMNNKSVDFASYYAANEDVALKQYETIMKSYEEIDS